MGYVPLKEVTTRSPRVWDVWKEAPEGSVSKDQRPRKAMSLSLIVWDWKLTLFDNKKKVGENGPKTRLGLV